MLIRNILNVPETMRAMPEPRKRIRRPKPAPSKELMNRFHQLEEAGFNPEMKWDRLSKSYYILTKALEVPSWHH